MEKKVKTEDLKIGMYVARLDRPWVDTPFMFQGFYIRDQKDIDTLRQYCHYIFTDYDRQELDDYRLQHMRAEEYAAKPGACELPTRKVNYETTTSIEEELVFARECHTNLAHLVNEIMTDVRAGKEINFPGARKIVSSMIESIARNPDAFMWLTKLKDTDSYTYKHSMDAAILAVTLGRHLGLTKHELQELAIGTLLFDIGKMKLPPELLSKPGRLTDAEFTLVKKHVEYSVDTLKQIKGISPRSIEIAMYHHERHNGSGYPHGLRGNQIPVFARIAAIVDCYDAITSDRTYNRAISSHDAIKQLYEWRNIDFQEEMIEQFIQCLGVYPTGSLVELSTGEVGVVLSQNRVRRLRPKIMLILDKDKVAYDHYPTLDLIKEETDKEGKPLEILTSHEPGAFGIDPHAFYL